MQEIQATEAKAHLAELLTRVARGESIAITRHGQRVAHLIPAQIEENKQRAATIQAFRKKQQSWPKAGLSREEISDLRHDGHRY